MNSVFFETFGCQMNVADSDLIADLLIHRGWQVVDIRETANLVVLNTCSVREHAEVRAKARLREYTAAQRGLPSKQTIWVIGCMAQRLGNDLKKEIRGIDRVIGAQEIEYIDQHIDEYLGDLATHNVPTASGVAKVTAFLPVMRGCDNYCAYCIVPYVRGHEHSISALALEESARQMIDNGVSEISLLGQNVNSYHDGTTDFPDLLTRLCKIPGLKRLRFTTSHPKDCSQKLLEIMAQEPVLCKHLHLPVQSGSTAVLTAMNRRYTREDYLRVVDTFRKLLPNGDLTTDIMVGFPGETDKDFQDTLELVKQVRFTSAFMFAFSPRKGTAAEKMEPAISKEEKSVRLSELIQIQNDITKEQYKKMVGSDVSVLVTGRQASREKLWFGLDYGCKSVLIAGDGNLTGSIFNAKVIRSTGKTLVAQI